MIFLKKNLELNLDEKRMAIEWDHSELSLRRQMELLSISPGAIYYKPLPMNAYSLDLMDMIDRQYLETPFYGSRRMTAFLNDIGHLCNRKRVQRLMRMMGIEAIYPKQNLSKASAKHKIYPYLLREVEIIRPNQVWSTDITYVRINGGFVYLVAIIDWFSRYVLSWRISNSLETIFCIEALEEAFKYGLPEIFNMDQGYQFTSENYVKNLLDKSIKVSMDGKGRALEALDNIFIERLWRSLKYEEIYLKDYRNYTFKNAHEFIGKYFKFYNFKRLHQSLEYKTPYVIHFGV
jgi:putative transposase